MAPRTFPPGFLWGTATSAHQVEGNNTNNQWWDWEQQPGRIWHGDRSGAACDWWRNAEADLGRAAALGQNAHRLSIEWSRIEQQPGVFSVTALARYRVMLQTLRDHGMTPMVTLHHFTNPRWLQAAGGWLNPQTPALFARFAACAVDALGDLCNLWCTINEPVIYATQGFLLGHFPPGAQNIVQTLHLVRQMLLGHAAAAAAIHRVDASHRVGIVHHVRLFDPASAAPADTAVAALWDYLFNTLVTQAVHTGCLLPPLGFGLRVNPDLRASCDFLGLNYYTREYVAFDRGASDTLFGRRFTPAGVPQSDAGKDGTTYGELYAAGLYRALRRLAPFGLPIYITEFGLPDADDDQRPQFLLDHLSAVHHALQAGIDVRGVFHWSLIDNFEWAEGWNLRFGLYALDQHTQQRTLRKSGALYAAIARANALPGPPALSPE